MKEQLDEIERLWKLKESEHTKATEELGECRARIGELEGQLRTTRVELQECKTKWNDLMKKIEGEMKK